MDEISRLHASHGRQRGKIHQQRPVAIESDDFALWQTESHAQRNRGAESKSTDAKITVPGPQRIPFEGHRPGRADDQRIARYLGEFLETVESLHEPFERIHRDNLSGAKAP